MAKIISINEHFQHFLTDLKDSFWGDFEAKTRLAWKQFLEAESQRMRNLYMSYESYEHGIRFCSNGLLETTVDSAYGSGVPHRIVDGELQFSTTGAPSPAANATNLHTIAS